MEPLVKYLTTEWGVILQAPAIFVTAAALIMLFVWGIFRWSYASRIEALDGRLKLRDDQISDYKQKLSGATPEEARNRVDALELQVNSLLPRRLSVEQRQSILGVIRKERFRIEIRHDMGASEARKFCSDITATFKVAGWEVIEIKSLGLSNYPPSGNALIVIDPNALRPAERAVKHALEAANLAFDIQPGLRVNPPPPELPPGFPALSQQPNPEVGLLFTERLD